MTTSNLTAKTRREDRTRDIVYIGAFTAIIAVCSWISIPTTVPFTLQTLAVFAAGGILGGRRATVSVLIYLLLGAIGLPVFSGFTGGMGILFGVTGGYLLGFILSTLLMWVMESLFGKSRLTLIVSMILGLLVCYTVGTIWFMIAYSSKSGAIGIGAVLGWCVIPFIIPDLIKIAIAVILTDRLRNVIR